MIPSTRESPEAFEWYAARTDPDITTVIGGLGRFTFGWKLRSSFSGSKKWREPIEMSAK